MVLIQTSVGLPSFQAGGSTPGLRSGTAGELIEGQAGLQLVEAVRAGQLFTASTINTGVTVASLTLTTSAPTAMGNPSGSGVNAYLKSISAVYVSGTIGTGAMFLVGHPNSAAVTGTAATYINSCMIGSTATPKCNVTYTSTVAASGKVIQNMFTTEPFVATDHLAPGQPLTWDFSGGFGVAPGSAVSVQGIMAAGSSPLLVFTWVWQEVAIS